MADFDINQIASTLDSEDMIGFTRAFVEDIRRGLNAVNLDRYPWIEEIANGEWQGVLALGMGGSAAGGDFLSAICDLKGSVPVVVQRDYVIPAWWDEQWLVVATSHSGVTLAAVNARHTAKWIATGEMPPGFEEFSAKRFNAKNG